MGSLDASFNGCKDGKLGCLFLGYALVYTEGMRMVKCLAVTKASNWDLLALNCLALYLEIYIESHLGLIFEQSWVP